MDRTGLLRQLDKAWVAFTGSYLGLSDAQLVAGGVVGDWSVRDVIAHVTTWEEEALKHLPLILKGGRAPRYSVSYGGINAFNRLMTERKEALSISEVLREQDEIHRRLVGFVLGAPEELFVRETRFRRRLRLDTYSHYPKHTEAIRKWRAVRGLE
jgi:DinB superfamily